MNFKSKAKNHHYISQVEQKLNSIDNNETHIYKINVNNNTDKNRVKIEKTLSLNHLFCFNKLDKNNQYNFEVLFNEYERNIKKYTKSLINKINKNNYDIEREVINLFASKFLNIVRNPYLIKENLENFQTLTRHTPTAKEEYDNLERVVTGNKPQEEYICKKLNTNKNDYEVWLGVIYMLLAVKGDKDRNFLDFFIVDSFQNNYCSVHIYHYDDEVCLLSDRNYPIEHEACTVYDFNLCSNAFIRYVFCDINKLEITKKFPKKTIEDYKLMPKIVFIGQNKGDTEALKKYNERVIAQSKHYFYSSKETY